MYSHPFTAEHSRSLQEKLGYLISGPQGAGMLACGDEGAVKSEGLKPDQTGPGKMTDWHDIVDMINTFSEVFHLRRSPSGSVTKQYPLVPTVINPAGVKRASQPHTTATFGAGQVQGEGAEQRAEGYTGELGDSSDSSQNARRSASEVSAPLRWRDIWPEL